MNQEQAFKNTNQQKVPSLDDSFHENLNEQDFQIYLDDMKYIHQKHKPQTLQSDVIVKISKFDDLNNKEQTNNQTFTEFQFNSNFHKQGVQLQMEQKMENETLKKSLERHPLQELMKKQNQ